MKSTSPTRKNSASTIKMPKLLLRGSPLVFLSIIEYGVPLLRSIALSRLVTLPELGFASLLTAVCAAFELITDFSLYRFVLSTPREQFEEALASAHALAIVRGLSVGAALVLLSPLIAAGFSLSDHWLEFALLGGVVALRSFEHLGPKVGERDYNYGPQFKMAALANLSGLSILILTAVLTRSHWAMLASMYTQSGVQTVASHVFAGKGLKYKVKFRSKLFWQGLKFGYPLMINGVGIAAAMQGDRFFVGGFLGLEEVGIYSVMILVALMPLSLVNRFTSTVLFGLFYNAPHGEAYNSRLRLAARSMALISVLFAVGVLTLLNEVVPLVFGPQFVLSHTATILLAVTMFFRCARSDPFTSMLLQAGETSRLATANFPTTTSLVFEFVLLLIFRNLEAVILGRLLGELVGFATTMVMTRHIFRAARRDYAITLVGAASLLAIVIALTFTSGVGHSLTQSCAAVAACFAICGFWAQRFTPPLLRGSFPK
jgi:O-antigen/teichoic acid export membrane protein